MSKTSEIQRLKALLPPQLQLAIAVVPSESKNCSPIATKKLTQTEFSVQIDFRQWQFFTASQRDLLFWHEIARIQNRGIARPSWELIAISIGLSAAVIELISRNVFSSSIALTAAGLAFYKLYQRKFGEQSLRELSAADQTAIELAMQSGYSFSEAHNSLCKALQILTQQPTQKSCWSKYQVRLRVLEMLAARKEQPLSTAHFEF